MSISQEINWHLIQDPTRNPTQDLPLFEIYIQLWLFMPLCIAYDWCCCCCCCCCFFRRKKNRRNKMNIGNKRNRWNSRNRKDRRDRKKETEESVSSVSFLSSVFFSFISFCQSVPAEVLRSFFFSEYLSVKPNCDCAESICNLSKCQTCVMLPLTKLTCNHFIFSSQGALESSLLYLIYTQFLI